MNELAVLNLDKSKRMGKVACRMIQLVLRGKVRFHGYSSRFVRVL